MLDVFKTCSLSAAKIMTFNMIDHINPTLFLQSSLFEMAL